MSTALASHLVKAGVIDPAQADDILQRQVLYGGSLDTQLLETGALDEAQCLAALAAVHGMPAIGRAELDATPPEVPVTFPLLFAQMHNLVPHRFEKGALIAVSNRPPAAAELAGLTRRLGVEVQLRVTSEVRIHYALQRLYGIDPPPRFARILHKLDGKPSGGLAGSARMAAAWTALFSPRAPDGGEASDWRPFGRLDLEVIRSQLNEARERDQVVDVLLQAFLTTFEFAGLFAVFHGAIHGWSARGGTGAETIHAVSLPLTMPSMLQTVALTESPYLGRVAKNSVNKQLLTDLGRPWPPAVLLVPLRVGGKVIALAYGDSKTRNIHYEQVQDLVVVAVMAAHALENVIKLRKHHLRKALAGKQELAAPVEAEPAFEALSDIVVFRSDVAAQPLTFVEQPEQVAEPDGWDDLDLADALPAAAAAAADGSAAPARADDAWEDVLYDGLGQAAAQVAEQVAAPAPVAAAQRPPEALARWREVIDELRHGTQRAIASTQAEQMRPWLDALDGDPAGWEAALTSLRDLPLELLEPELVRRFPGTLAVDPFQAGVRLPLPEDLSPLLRLIVDLGERAGGAVRACLALPEARQRFVAAYLLSRLDLPALVEPLGGLLGDPEPKVRFAASYAMRRYAGTPGYEAVLAGVRAGLGAGLTQQIESIHLLSQLRDARSIPELVQLLPTAGPALVTALTAALLTITGQALGRDLKAWRDWWTAHGAEEREQWLLAGLSSADATVRTVAFTELVALTGFDAGYQPQGAPAERAAAIARWRDWLAARRG